ncbi:hypothetical protein Enr13x_24040 [Stieleria neptunia]|uniref:Uncharacterized protein n=1 Tax=Stieleria neptunia TaxID=2527979 RepID=A0A518HNY4_9BACT|nr:hypothetical protein [Stieleria neptunia]QDV42556.1 hypothetical protein Enr13x_24040 [Stieleria neptunia]
MTKLRDSFPASFLVALLLALPVIGLAAFWLLRFPADIDIRDEPLPVSRRSIEKKVGGVNRPVSDLSLSQEAEEVLAEAREFQQETLPRPNRAELSERPQGLQKSMNPNVASVIEAIETGLHPERLTPNILPAPFDEDAYMRNPQAYLDIAEPGRVYQSAQPGLNVKSVGPVGRNRHTIKQLESVRLKVKAAPNYPVTFTSFDLGAFENKLPTITVAAGEDGIASAEFTGTEGTVNDVTILAASPMASGRVHFVVTILH